LVKASSIGYLFNLCSCFDFQSYHTYRERVTLEREIIRARKQRQRLPDRRYHSAEQGYSGSQTEDAIAQSATNQSSKKQNSAQQNGYSSKSSVPDGDFVRFKEHVATDGGTKQAVGRDFVEEGRQTKPPSSSSGIVLPQWSRKSYLSAFLTCHSRFFTCGRKRVWILGAFLVGTFLSLNTV